MSNVIVLQPHTKPSLQALRRAGWAVLSEFANDRARRRTLFNEIVRIAFDEPSPPERSPRIRYLVTELGHSYEEKAALTAS